MSGPNLLTLPMLRKRALDEPLAHQPVDGCDGNCEYDPCPPAARYALWGPFALRDAWDPLDEPRNQAK